jgi:cell division protein ZapB
MLNELNALESKVAQAVALCRRLRSENDELREQLVAAQADHERVAERMAAACARIEQLAQQLPETQA